MLLSWVSKYIPAIAAIGAFASPFVHDRGSLLPGSPNCTSTQHILGKFTAGPVCTIWTATTATTVHIDCSGCRFLATETLGYGRGHGPVVHFSTTTAAATPRTTTTYLCRPYSS
ncbi:hypothetical protein CMQ_924 [Grosmannia clavigera kw1407]|uniref:Uncharacterized protein n=1 Tax=Grosmannia clavigera (strain kw1407 / UAMH 11150) TaxID=655863 RepID=F0XCC5_GROCL|nr:uncharacterized protein CMQ_924 [Grosmannia clavigera kw1407]EFX03996.1 hypothetical protein CMQ_924 [Grosmannia clavigera kw1407]